MEATITNPRSRKIVLCAFADSSLDKVIKRFIYEARESHFFDDIIVYTEKDLDEQFWNRHKDFITHNKRGYGYWVWKPYIVNRTLKSLRPNDILMYLDIGCVINVSGKKSFERYIRLIDEFPLGCVCFYNGYIEKDWDKGDAIDFFNVRGNRDILESQQIMSGIFFLRNWEKNQELIQRWEDIDSNHYHLIDDSPSVSPNLEGFVENRHDQTILSLLIKTTGGACCLPDTEVEVDMPYRRLGQRTYRRFKQNPFLAIRDRDGIIYKKQNKFCYALNCIKWDIQNLLDDYKAYLRRKRKR